MLWLVNCLQRLSPSAQLALKKLTCKTVVLLALLTAQRVQTLKLITLDSMMLTKHKVTMHIDQLLKQSRPGQHLADIQLKAYAPDRRLCIVRLLNEYVTRSAPLRGQEKKLLISFVEPHKHVGTQTIARWLKDVFAKGRCGHYCI